MKLRVGSLSSGIGGDHVAWAPLGWEPVFVSEIAAFPSAVLAHRLPGVPNLGDFTAPDFCDRAREAGPIDVFAGGTPCQAFSVAGKRKSLDDERGNLSLRFVEIVHELDPAVVVWENVPGVLSTKDNAFGCFLAGLVGEPYPLESGLARGRWPNAGVVVGPIRTLCWRVLDAQYFALAQRRRRVCLVSFRTRDGINPAAVLLEPESLRRDSPPSREAGARAAGALAGCSGGSGHRVGADEAAAGRVIPSYWDGGQVADCLDASQLVKRQTMPDKRRFPAVVQGIIEGDSAASTPNLPRLRAGCGRGGETAIAFNARQDPDVSGPVTGPLDTDPGTQAVAFQQHGSDVGKMGALRAGHGDVQSGVPFVAGTLAASGGGMERLKAKSGQTGKGDGVPCVAADRRVRRLTPRECERLQGFPDGWTRIPWRKKGPESCPDGPRYKGLGNAWATNVFRWIGRRIEMVLEASGRDLAQESADGPETANGVGV